MDSFSSNTRCNSLTSGSIHLPTVVVGKRLGPIGLKKSCASYSWFFFFFAKILKWARLVSGVHVGRPRLNQFPTNAYETFTPITPN